METVVAEFEHLKKAFGENVVLQDISLKLNSGENLVIFGKSGSGKSVLLKCLVGLMKPDEGTVRLFGSDIAAVSSDELNQLRKKIGFLFQGGALYDSMTVGENLAFTLRGSELIKDQEQLVQDALKNVGLEDTISKMPAELSGGMRKRVALARALMLNPGLILYDEPTTGLDPITTKEISHLVRDIQEKYNTAAIIITHDIACARITADRVVFINNGLNVSEGTFAESEASPDEWVRSFFL
jgi:phospholipid/cholesterol/gamma-HCH transport system ATP-binding protein